MSTDLVIPSLHPVTMSQIFRRSNLPVWLLGGNAAPPEAPKDPQVRHWIRNEKHGKEALAAARVIEKALARKPETLDLSAVPPRLLDGLTGSLMQRLSRPTQTLRLPQDCPVDLALRLMCVIRARHIEPKPMMAAVEEAQSPRPLSKPRGSRPRTPSVPAELAPTPEPAPTSTDSSVYDVPPRRTGHDYAIPPRRTGHDYAIPPRRGDKDPGMLPRGSSKDHDVPRRRDGGVYERPEPLVLPQGPASLQRRDGKDHAVDASPFEGADYVEGSDDVEGSNDVSIEPRRASAGRADPVYANGAADSTEDLMATRRQGELLDKHIPPASFSVTVQEVNAAVIAMRAPRAWYQTHARDEGRYPRCAISSRDASDIARALLGMPMEHLRSEERQAMLAAKRALALHRPNTMLQLDPEAVGHLDLALDAVSRLVASTDPTPPALPERNRSTGPLPHRPIRSGG